MAHLIDSALWSFLITSIMFGLFWQEIAMWFQQVMIVATNGSNEAPPPPPLPLWFQVIFNYIVPIGVLVILWKWKAATPGKMMLGLKVVDAETQGPLSMKQCVLRMLGYMPPMVPLMLFSLIGVYPQTMLILGAVIFTSPLIMGFLSITSDPRHQGWHDKIARTLVIKTR